ncbi:hypothetical protein A2924_03525 [Candidatus Giovannonibacteria bacterium RIFCSPLOWO2_01_FULL_44_16]|uniref:Uncharacterized protein n=1 Tax=Candidatus Giovannonibacteria bacterium RIFCSPLOWO2_01_FULL_44_16 TaxID=1798348 RepID=A0A1F5X4F7_9BACT|nr:MAG: hypothetical protein A2924_03525 [Candidatus Giovannonibacteria bacterium RIFCSPLOWO2_01_FULL_44_16]
MNKTIAGTRTSNIVHRQVAAAFREILSDPDAGLEFSRVAGLRLKKSIRSSKTGKTKGLSEVLNKYR